MNTEALRPLEAIPSTLLITVWGRARSALRSPALVDDDLAISLFQDNPALFDGLEKLPRFVRRLTELGIGIRSRCFDGHVARFLSEHPKGLVINIGSGLDARSSRLDNGQATWVHVDVPESTSWARELLPAHPRRQEIEGSLTDPAAWLAQVPHEEGQAVYVISEGTFMYFSDDEIRLFLAALFARFPKCEGTIELVGDLAKGKVHPTVKAVGASVPFRSGYRDPAQALASMHSHLTVTHEESLFQYEREQWSVFRPLTRLFPSLHKRLASVLLGFEVNA